MIVAQMPGVPFCNWAGRYALRLTLLAVVLFPRLGTAGEYVLQTGDALRIAIVGFPEFDITQTIDIDGGVTIWLAGSVSVAGMTLSEARREIADRLADELVTRRIYDGTETQTVINAPEVLVAVAEYRPIYVDGDVASPGEQAFRAGLTVRQAISLAGGYDIVRARTFDPFLAQSDILADEAELRRERARLVIAAARNAAELVGADSFAYKDFDVGLEPAEVSEMLELERGRLRLSTERLAADRASLLRLIEQIERRIESLRDQVDAREEAERLDQQNEDRVRSNFDRGLTAIGSLVDAQRAASESAARVREARADLFQSFQQLETTRRQLARLREERLDSLETERREIAARTVAVEARLTSALDKLGYVGEIRLRRLRMTPDEIGVMLHRGGPNGPISRPASLDTPLEPGDTVEVVLPAGMLLRPAPGQATLDGG